MRVSPKKKRRRVLDRRKATRKGSPGPLAFTGTMIEDLIKAVQKAEAQAPKLTVSEDVKKAS
jgi:hypothetical protein